MWRVMSRTTRVLRIATSTEPSAHGALLSLEIERTDLIGCAAVSSAFCNVARFSCLCRAFSGKPAARYALLFHPSGHIFLNHHAADNARVAHGGQDRAACIRRDAQIERNRAQFIAASSIDSIHDSKGRSCTAARHRGVLLPLRLEYDGARSNEVDSYEFVAASLGKARRARAIHTRIAPPTRLRKATTWQAGWRLQLCEGRGLGVKGRLSFHKKCFPLFVKCFDFNFRDARTSKIQPARR